MASKGALKKKKALDRRLKKRTAKIPAITNLGDYLQEFLLRGVYMFSLKRGQEIIQATTARIQALLQEKKYNTIVSLLELDKIPRERAQILVYQALATPDLQQAEKFIKQALLLDSSNIDARSWVTKKMLEAERDTPEQALTAMRDIVSFAERQLGPQLDILTGKIHDFPLARPYLRSLYTLFTSLESCGLDEEALSIGEKILTLCEPDIFTIRDRVTRLKTPGQSPIVTEEQTALQKPSPAPLETPEEEDYSARLDKNQAQVFEEICQKTDAFCEAHLDARIAGYARRAVFQLCREDDFGAKRGKRESWSSGIIHALALANNLFNPDHPLAIQPVTIHTFFKISSSTTSKKSALLRKCLQITTDNPDWICPG